MCMENCYQERCHHQTLEMKWTMNRQGCSRQGGHDTKQCTVKPVYSGHPLGQDKLAVVERWPDYRVQFQQISTLWVTTI